MPTFEPTPRFAQDYKKLTADQKARFQKVVKEHFVPDLEEGQFRASLRIKGVHAAPGVFELTWAPDGRATWQYGPERYAGMAHVIWRRVGTHAIFSPGPP